MSTDPQNTNVQGAGSSTSDFGSSSAWTEQDMRTMINKFREENARLRELVEEMTRDAAAVCEKFKHTQLSPLGWEIVSILDPKVKASNAKVAAEMKVKRERDEREREIIERFNKLPLEEKEKFLTTQPQPAAGMEGEQS